MSQQLGPTIPPWGIASEKRGLRDKGLAYKFIEVFKVGNEYLKDEFDRWIETQYDELKINVPGKDIPRQSDTVKAYLHRRSEIVGRLNIAGCHPRMRPNAFRIVMPKGETFEVLSPETAAIEKNIADAVLGYARYQKKQLRVLMQSVDFSSLSIRHQLNLESAYLAVDDFEGMTVTAAQQLGRRIERAKEAIAHDVKTGQIAAGEAIQTFIGPADTEE